jgi:hypothetical protein
MVTAVPDGSSTNNDSSPRTFTVASRDAKAPVDRTIQAVEDALRPLPGATIVRTDREIGVVIIQIGDQQIEKIREELGDGFMVDPNATLKF